MKKFTMIVALLLMVAMPMMAERVSPETARKVAQTFLNNNGAKSAQLTDLSKAAGFANLYIFNGEEGFVVMSADDCVQPILGYSLTGKFVTEGMPENVRGWLQGYSDEIQYAVDRRMRATGETAKIWKDLIEGNAKAGRATTVVAPLIQTQWNQNGYNNVYLFNNLCPTVSSGGHGGHAFVGCVATAMAQIMKYWNHPAQGTGSHSYTWNGQTLGADFGSTTYDWQHMTNTYSSTSTGEEKQAVDVLMYHCGVSVEMNYGGSGSSASTNDVMNALQTYFGYAQNMQYKSKDSFTDDQWISLLKSELDDNRPMQYRGSDAGGRGGHSFVCDGYDSSDNFHFNWGWAGYCDGYYSINDMEPGIGGTGAGNGVYTVGQAAIFGIEPVSTLTAPTLTANVSEGVATLTWNAIAEATTYNVYKDNMKIAEGITQTTFNDNNLSFGIDYDYYVRAVASGIKSNPSNTVTVNSNYRSIVPSDLAVNYENGSATLNWTGYEGEASTDLHYGINYSNGYYGYSGNYDTYWGQKYPAQNIVNFQGMFINKIAFYAAFTGDYSLYLYKSNTSNTSNLLWSQSINITETGWNDIVISSPSPITLDISNDLWVVLHAGTSIGLPATYSNYSGENVEHARYISTSLNNWAYVNRNISWCIRTYLTDGTYTYNLYDGTTQLASGLTETTYTHASPAQNAAHQYTVKTNYYGGESAASNVAGLTLGTASLSSLELGENDKMTLTEGSELTVGGTLTNTNPANLILENGAELVHNTEGVQATVKKTITPPSANDYGWYFIASPVTESITPSEENGFLNGTAESNTYDLYYYDETDHKWMNHESSAFSLLPQKGYLYANVAPNGTTLQFAGTLTPSNSPVTINDLSHIASSLNGFNLVGNPFACNATVNKDFYVVDNTTGKVILASNGSEIAPCAGIFVKATANDASVTFTKAASRVEPSSSSFDITLKQSAERSTASTLDRARVRLGDAETLEKFSIGDGEGCVIYFPQNGQDLAVACANGQNEMPLNFKAAKNGIYTLAFEVENLDLDYLHLIDNMTGDEIDVLAMPNYSFEAKTSDYASRFRLVFAENETDGASTGSAAFAYITDGEILINEADASDVSLQVVDMTGHVVVSVGGHTRRVPTTGIPAGVYVLRLINGDTVRTQKIVIE